MFMVSRLSCGCLTVSQSEGSCPRFTFKLDFCRIQYTPPCFSWILQKHSTLFFNPYLTNTLFSYCLFAISSIAILSYSRTLCIVMGLLLNQTLHLQYYWPACCICTRTRGWPYAKISRCTSHAHCCELIRIGIYSWIFRICHNRMDIPNNKYTFLLALYCTALHTGGVCSQIYSAALALVLALHFTVVWCNCTPPCPTF